MTRFTKAFVALGAMLTIGGVAQAHGQQKAKTAAREEAGGQATKEMTGRVVQAGASKLFVEHMGAVVAFNIAPDTRFSGRDVRSSSDLKEGQEVRTTFTIENKVTNVAKQVTLAHETSGSAAGAPGHGSSAAPGTHSPSAPVTPTPQESGTTPK